MSRRALPHRLLRPASAVAALILLCIPALQPLLGSELTCGYDNQLHLWRAVEADALLESGTLFSRWQPHMALGFGYPLHTFNPPGSALLAALIHRAGLGWEAAVNAVFALGMLFAALTMWLLVREWYGDLAGVVAGAILPTMPFHAYVVYHRGSMSEALAWAFPPLILWGLIRWQLHRQCVGLAAAAGGLAAMLLTHDASTYLFLPMALVACLALAFAQRSKEVLGRGLLALVLGLGLAAFFWASSVLERSDVQFGRVTAYPYAASFVALDYLLEPPRSFDASLVNPWLPKGIGLLAAAFSLAAAGAWVRAGRTERVWLAGIAVVTAGCVWLALPYAWPVWRAIPALPYLHFPWRFLTPAAFGVAFLAGAGARWLSRLAGKASPAVCPAIAALVSLGSLGWLYPTHCALAQPATLTGMLAYEQQTGQLGTTTFTEVIPRWATRLPSSDLLVEDIAAGREPERLRPQFSDGEVHVLDAEYAPLHATIELESPTGATIHYLALYYPGWQVRVDGEATPVTPSQPDGLLTFSVPAGRHTLHIRFVETPARLVADGVSLVSLVALGLALWATARTPQSLRRESTHAIRN